MVFVALWVSLSCRSEGNGPEAAKGPERQVVPVVLGKAAMGDVPVEVQAVGSVEAYATVSITSRVAGRVEKVHFKEGDRIEPGAMLFTIDPRQHRAELQRAEAQLARDQELAKQSESDAERASRLSQAGVTSEQETERARSNAASLASTLQADRAAVETARLMLGFTSIRAPITGRAGSLLVNAGNVVKADGDVPLVVLRQVQPIFVRFAVPERYLFELRERMRSGDLPVEATPRGAQAKPVTGKLTFIENTVNVSTGTVELKALFENDDEALWPGQYVDVVLRLSLEKNVITVPEAAVQLGQDGSYVWVVDAERTAQLTRVEVDRVVSGRAVVRQGLEAGMDVVVDGQVRLATGSTVEPQAPKASEAATQEEAVKESAPGAAPTKETAATKQKLSGGPP